MDLAQSWQFDKDSKKQSLHFYHANGFPLGVYQPLLDLLSQQYNVGALANRATWQPSVNLPQRRDWHIYADDMITFIEQQNVGPVIGVGHSMGATCTVLAAQKRPDLFSKVVLIEPAMVTKTQAALVKIMPKSVMYRINPAKGTLKKPDVFANREQFITYIRKFKGYQKFEDSMFELFSRHAIVENDNEQFELAFSKHWEAHNYSQPPNVMNNITKLTMPVVAIRAKPSIFFSQAMWQQWQDLQPQTKFLEALGQGHLLPLESPDLCCDLIEKGLK